MYVTSQAISLSLGTLVGIPLCEGSCALAGADLSRSCSCKAKISTVLQSNQPKVLKNIQENKRASQHSPKSRCCFSSSKIDLDRRTHKGNHPATNRPRKTSNPTKPPPSFLLDTLLNPPTAQTDQPTVAPGSVALVMILYGASQWLNYDLFGLFVGARQVVRATRPECQRASVTFKWGEWFNVVGLVLGVVE